MKFFEGDVGRIVDGLAWDDVFFFFFEGLARDDVFFLFLFRSGFVSVSAGFVGCFRPIVVGPILFLFVGERFDEFSSAF
jgi:hypothetical protein